MTVDAADLRLLGALATLLSRANPIPQAALADAEAAGLRLTHREPRLPNREADLAWLLPG
jgi:sugar/nucleoside kinase (ribokinase family)